MRLIVAWANVITENLALKFSLACLIVVIFVLSAVVIRLSGRKPLLIERACYSRVLAIVDSERSTAEVESFVREALSLRFDTVAQLKPGYLSSDEEKFRGQEQQELKKREISQRILVNGVVVNGESIVVDASRLLGMGSVKSVLPFSLMLKIATVSRTEWNPYGLLLIQVSTSALDVKPEGGKR